MEQQDQLEETIVQSMNRTILVTQVFLLLLFFLLFLNLSSIPFAKLELSILKSRRICCFNKPLYIQTTMVPISKFSQILLTLYFWYGKFVGSTVSLNQLDLQHRNNFKRKRYEFFQHESFMLFNFLVCNCVKGVQLQELQSQSRDAKIRRTHQKKCCGGCCILFSPLVKVVLFLSGVLSCCF